MSCTVPENNHTPLQKRLGFPRDGVFFKTKTYDEIKFMKIKLERPKHVTKLNL